mmetsp:Transcript_35907/g.105168  ORF Transcript_35907/g.105168 Transcript_35907/m.105168 type:complete len:215 (-) Transcript_35907:192-836(-)
MFDSESVSSCQHWPQSDAQLEKYFLPTRLLSVAPFLGRAPTVVRYGVPNQFGVATPTQPNSIRADVSLSPWQPHPVKSPKPKSVVVARTFDPFPMGHGTAGMRGRGERGGGDGDGLGEPGRGGGGAGHGDGDGIGCGGDGCGGDGSGRGGGCTSGGGRGEALALVIAGGCIDNVVLISNWPALPPWSIRTPINSVSSASTVPAAADATGPTIAP